MLLHPLTYFETQKYYQNKSKLIVVYSQNNLPNIVKVGAYVVSLDQHKSTGTHGIALYANGISVRYFDSFDVEHSPKNIKRFIGNKNIITNIFRIRAYDLILYGYFCMGFIDFMFKGKTLTDFTNLFLPYDFKKNEDYL